MKFAGIRAMLPIAFAALALAASGCDKAKSLAEDAAGFSLLEDGDRDAILAQVGWDTTKNPGLASFKVHKAFEVKDNFKGDFSKDASFPIPLDTPSQAQGQADKQRSALLCKVEEFSTDDKTKYTRLRIITVARIDSAEGKIVIEGEKINEYIPANKQVSLAAGNQAGKYILIEGEKVQLAFLTGDVKFIAAGKADADAVAVPGETLVFTSSSPFVTTAGDESSGGKYFLAMLEGSTGTVFGFNKTIGATYTGTPTTVSKEMAYSGVLDQYKGQVDEKAGKLGDPKASAKSDELFNKANKVVTDFMNGWKLVVTDLRFKQPPQAAPAKAPEPAKPPTPAPTTPTTDKPADPAPKTDSPVVRKPAGEVHYNVDLGCNGFGDDNKELDILRDGSKFDDYDNNPGWRAAGNVEISYDLADKIFPIAGLGANYLDGVPGYCVLATGDQQYATSKDASFQPGPDGAGQTSEMWQKVNVPGDVKAIQFRVAFFSSEFPVYVGTQFNDSFFIKFDESTDLLAFGNLNDLAGGQDAVTSCSGDNKTYKAGNKCGEWVYTKDLIGHGDLWDVRSSTQTPADGAASGYNCADTATAGATNRCYHGMIASRIICKDLTDKDIGQIRTLRFSVSDAGDAYYDSALAVDSVVFSKTACGDATGRMTPATVDPDSKARTAN